MDGRINFMSIAEISINYNGGNELKPTEETITINRNDAAKRSEKNHTHINKYCICQLWRSGKSIWLL